MLKSKRFLHHFRRQYSTVSDLRNWISTKLDKSPTKIEFNTMRIAPISQNDVDRNQFIPLTRSSLIRTLSQDVNLVKNEKHFEDFCRYLDSCLANRLFFFFKELKTSYEHLNPDVVKILSSGPLLNAKSFGTTKSRNETLDNEYWFCQKLSHLLALANFKELDRNQLQKCLKLSGGPTSVQAWLNYNNYELVKVWVLGHDETQSKLKQLFSWQRFKRLSSPATWKLNPYKSGQVYRRVALAVRLKGEDKIQLKLYKDLSLGELIHIFPSVSIGNSKFDNSVFLWTIGIFTVSTTAHVLMGQLATFGTLSSSWIMKSSITLLDSLVVLTVMVFLGEWHVSQTKKCSYWKWKSELNYNSIVANNRGVISILSDRAHDEILKEALLCYVHIGKYPSGISLAQLETEVETWVKSNCGMANYFIDTDLEEAIQLLRQLNVVAVSAVNGLMTAKSLEHSLPILGTEYRLSHSQLLHQHHEHHGRHEDTDGYDPPFVDSRNNEPPTEAFESKILVASAHTANSKTQQIQSSPPSKETKESIKLDSSGPQSSSTN